VACPPFFVFNQLFSSFVCCGAVVCFTPPYVPFTTTSGYLCLIEHSCLWPTAPLIWWFPLFETSIRICIGVLLYFTFLLLPVILALSMTCSMARFFWRRPHCFSPSPSSGGFLSLHALRPLRLQRFTGLHPALCLAPPLLSLPGHFELAFRLSHSNPPPFPPFRHTRLPLRFLRTLVRAGLSQASCFCRDLSTPFLFFFPRCMRENLHLFFCAILCTVIPQSAFSDVPFHAAFLFLFPLPFSTRRLRLEERVLCL